MVRNTHLWLSRVPTAFLVQSLKLSFVLVQFLETLKPIKPIIYFYYSRFGRKRTIIAYSILSGICVVAVSLIPHGTDSIGNKKKTWIACSDNLDWK